MGALDVVSREVRRMFRKPAPPRQHAQRVQSVREEYDRRLSMTLREWLLYHQNNIIFKQSTWLGVPCLKCPLDAWVYQEIVHEVRPDVFIEIGSHQGGSTMFFASLLECIGSGTVVSVDIDRSVYKAQHPRIINVTGDSSSPEVVDQVASICRGKTVMALHDGDHKKPQVLRDLEAYAPMITPGSYFIVEDGIVDLFEAGDSIGLAEEGPMAAALDFVAAHPEFEMDESRERYLMTYSPRGFLKRVR